MRKRWRDGGFQTKAKSGAEMGNELNILNEVKQWASNTSYQVIGEEGQNLILLCFISKLSGYK